MAISIDWGTRVIFVPKDYLTLVSGLIYELNTEMFRQDVIDIMDSAVGIPYPDPISHNTVVNLGGINYARTIEIINGYTVTFEDDLYAVNLVGSNNNIADVSNVNQVSIRPNNSAGLIDNSLATVGNDTQAPTWVSAIGITDLYQDGHTLTARWGVAIDNFNEQVIYNVYLSEFESTLYEDYNLIQSVDGNLTDIRFTDNAGSDFVDNTTYFIGVRAIDHSNNETDNTNFATLLYETENNGSVAAEVWAYPTRLLTSDPVAGDVNVVSVGGNSVTSAEDFKADLSLIPKNVWEYVARTLTAEMGMTPAQEAKLDALILDVEEEAQTIRNTTIAVS